MTYNYFTSILNGFVIMKPKENQKQKARLAQYELELARMKAHTKVVQILNDNLACKEVIDGAKKQIKLWRENNLCSSDFIQAWEELLANPSNLAEVLTHMDSFSIRMRQNSPFAAYLLGKTFNS